MFGHCGTQWAWAPSGEAGCFATGLPAERVEARARGLGVKVDRDFLWRFAVLEAAALDAMREK
ncbi:MAG: hypothetical protein HGA98_03405 [Deltaproteobacteria bacterium]|nr:hypothetical protein [Deltaproteobacteria bacterium]